MSTLFQLLYSSHLTLCRHRHLHILFFQLRIRSRFCSMILKPDPPYLAPCSSESLPPKSPGSSWEFCNTQNYQAFACPPGGHAKSNHSQRCTFYISSAPSPDDQATAYGSAYIEILFSTTLCAQSSPASCPSTESLPYYCAVGVSRVYP